MQYSELDQRRDENCMGLEIYEIAIMSTRPVHKNLFVEILKKPGSFVLPVDI